MKKITLIFFLISASNVLFAQYQYPATKTVDSSDTWHNVVVKDPYRWMEDLKNEETIKWFKAQNDYTESIMNKLPMTDELYHDFLKLDSIEPDKIYKIRQVGSTYFYFNSKVSESKTILYKRTGESGKEEMLANSNMWGKDFNIADYEIDPYQQFIAITAAESGKEIRNVKFYDIAKKKYLTDSLPGMFAGFAPGTGNVYYLQQPSWDVHVLVSFR